MTTSRSSAKIFGTKTEMPRGEHLVPEKEPLIDGARTHAEQCCQQSPTAEGKRCLRMRFLIFISVLTMGFLAATALGGSTATRASAEPAAVTRLERVVLGIEGPSKAVASTVTQQDIAGALRAIQEFLRWLEVQQLEQEREASIAKFRLVEAPSLHEYDRGWTLREYHETDVYQDTLDYIYAQARIRGWDDRHWTCLDWLLQKESGAWPFADNPTSTAAMLFQFLRSTAENYRIDHPDLNGKWSSIEEQVQSGLDYIANRYADPCKAQRFHRANNFY